MVAGDRPLPQKGGFPCMMENRVAGLLDIVTEKENSGLMLMIDLRNWEWWHFRA